MTKYYDKTLKELLRELIDERLKSDGDTIARDEVRAWFQQRFPKFKRGAIDAHLAALSTNHRSRIHYNLRSDGSDDVLFQMEDRRRFRRHRAGLDPLPIRESDEKLAVEAGGEKGGEETADTTASAFAYEADLRDYLAKNLHLVEQGLSLYRDGEVTGIEYPTGGHGAIDILAVDKAGALVVIELKVSRGHDHVVGQLLRYMGWVRENLADGGQAVRGIIITRKVSEGLRLAASGLHGVSLMEYSLAVTLTPVTV